MAVCVKGSHPSALPLLTPPLAIPPFLPPQDNHRLRYLTTPCLQPQPNDENSPSNTKKHIEMKTHAEVKRGGRPAARKEGEKGKEVEFYRFYSSPSIL
ncbi:hypothetical protein E2C01_072534 [Portunus trituberculatus]|uniref:Uncharacterized protein n=1 Tax=Portunus trituberculatus TaxID=210409 RepID=A0A5B7I046_PORTR|nr:hypothetical protein [Portunus trituberculatus]